MGRTLISPSWLFPLLTVVALGCSDGMPETAPVSGTVTLDGKPVAGATVMFVPDDGGHPAIGETNEQGEYELTTFDPDDGALLGNHSATVTKIKTNSDMRSAAQTTSGLPQPNAPRGKIVWLVPARYSKGKTSNLKATVKSGSNEFSFALTLRP